MTKTILLNGESLTTSTLVELSSGDVKIQLTEAAWKKVENGRAVVEGILAEEKVAYGINTGFGLFSNVVISPDKLEILQANLIRSHASGVGKPLPLHRTRMLLALRINVLAKGHSGISSASLRQAIAAFNNDCISVVPEQGTVGASGDLAPLSHLALGLMGEGCMWDNPADGIGPKVPTGDAAEVLQKAGLKPMVLKAKEGLAMINGTQLIASLGAEAVTRAKNVANCADVVCALTLEGLKGTVNAFHPCIHKVRPHLGQGMVAARIRALVHPDCPSEISESHKYCGRVQDAYSLRCAPQVHGICHDTVSFVDSVLAVELNSATDNPMVFQGNPDITVTTTTGEEHHWPPSNALSPRPEPETPLTPVEQAKEEIKRLQALVDQIESNNDKVSEATQNVGSPLAAHKHLNISAEGAVVPSLEDMQRKDQQSTLYLGSEQVGGFVISGGNFHGEYPAKVLDYLAIGITEIAAISERRIERLVNPTLSNLPAFLVSEGGLNSGFMIAHCTAAALVSENKVLAHPSSVDSISTSAGKEDHVSMGGYSARKALEVVSNVEVVVAIELLAACQAIEFHRPLKTTPVLEKVHQLVRSKVAKWDQDRIMYTDINAATELVRSGQLWDTVSDALKSFPGTLV